MLGQCRMPNAGRRIVEETHTALYDKLTGELKYSLHTEIYFKPFYVVNSLKLLLQNYTYFIKLTLFMEKDNHHHCKVCC